MSQDPEDLVQVELTDERGAARKAWVCRIVAERDLTNIGPGGEEVTVAKKGDKGGYVECGVTFDEDGRPHPVLPVQPGEEGAPSDRYKDGLKGLSQEGTSWVHEGATLAGEASVRDNAQFVGPDAVATGADVYKDDVGAGGSHYRSTGANTFEGHGSYIDMTLETGSGYSFSGGTQVGGPVRFEAGAGEFCDGPDGGETMLFAAEEGSELTVATEEGFKSNGLTALDNAVLKGSFEGGKDLIVQNGTVDVRGARFTGPCVILGQTLGHEADGLELDGDAIVDRLAGPAGFDGEAYREHVGNVVAHELGENFADTGVQNHRDDIHDRMHGGLLDAWDQAPEGMTAEEFYGARRAASEYHAGLNDGLMEDMRDAADTTGATMEEAMDEISGTTQGKAWLQFSGIRGAHQGEALRDRTSGHSQREIGVGTEGKLNEKDASEGLVARGGGKRDSRGKGLAIAPSEAPDGRSVDDGISL